MQGFEFQTFGAHHLLYLAGVLGTAAAVVLWGMRTPDPTARRRAAWILFSVTLAQEFTWDAVGMACGVWTASEHLPLHLCSFALFVSAWAVARRGQAAFELAYFWGTVAASQALLTPDPTRWPLGEFDAFQHFLSHGMIVLNVTWLIFVEGMRLRPRAWLRAFAVTNAAALVVGAFDWVTGFNYFFLRRKPGGDSPFLVGDWPWYLLLLEPLALAFFFVAQAATRRRPALAETALLREPIPESSRE